MRALGLILVIASCGCTPAPTPTTQQPVTIGTAPGGAATGSATPRAVTAAPLSPTEPFEAGGKWGFKDAGGKVVIPPRFQMAQPFSAGGIAAVVEGNSWAYIDRDGRVLLRPLVVDNGPDDFSEGVARFSRGGRVGFFDESGRVVLEPAYEFALSFTEGLAAVCAGCRAVSRGEHTEMIGGTWGYIDRKGAVVISPRFDSAEPFKDGVARVRLGNAARTIDRRGDLR